jgi:mxaL protein
MTWPKPPASRQIALALACAALVLAAWGLQPRLPVSRFDGVIVLDITQSMNAEDYAVGGRPTSRLAAAKLALRHALEAMPCGSRVGLGVFTEYRTMVLIAPLEICANFRELTLVFDGIDGRMAWTGRSEVAKGINWAIKAADALPGQPAIVFVSDGHEAPPIHPAHRPASGGEAGKVPGLLVGVGGPLPVPIPKLDPDGRRLGFWGADEVMQTDPISRGRGGSIAGELYVETEEVRPPPGWPTTGNEHLSQLREGYLRLLAEELRFGYLRLDDVARGAQALAARMQQRPLARVAPTRVSLRPLFGVAGLDVSCRCPRSRARARDADAAGGPVRADTSLEPAVRGCIVRTRAHDYPLEGHPRAFGEPEASWLACVPSGACHRWDQRGEGPRDGRLNALYVTRWTALS